MWENLGMVLPLSALTSAGLRSHAMVPTPLLYPDKIRVFFSPRDNTGTSQIYAVDVVRDNPTQLLDGTLHHILSAGELGCFDDCGVTNSCALRVGKNIYLYYVGWNRMVTTAYRNAIGLAISTDDGQSFTRYAKGPVLDRNPQDPYFCTSPYVVQHDGQFHLWYSAITGFANPQQKPEPLYHIKYAHSLNGIDWQRDNVDAILPAYPLEALARANVQPAPHGGWEMWYCMRGSEDFRDGADSYRLGYATAPDVTHWTRHDESAEALPPRAAWDEKMQAYPAVLDVDGTRYMFYNGNGFGAEGFGVARWVKTAGR